jgi:hypothetical protein
MQQVLRMRLAPSSGELREAQTAGGVKKFELGSDVPPSARCLLHPTMLGQFGGQTKSSARKLETGILDCTSKKPGSADCPLLRIPFPGSNSSDILSLQG